MKQKIKKLIHSLVGDLMSKEDLHLMREIKNGTAKISYSQQCEDLTLLRYFENTAEGFYVDIGAFHPVAYSNTLLFSRKGWRGINIEPNYNHHLEFVKQRLNDININCGVGLNAGILKYYQFNAPALNTFSEENMLTWSSKEGFRVEKITDIPIKKLSEILDTHLPAKQKIDFFNIDVEGFDLQVLQSNNWDKYRPKVILIEESLYTLSSNSESEIFRFLQSINYRLWSATGGTLMFVEN